MFHNQGQTGCYIDYTLQCYIWSFLHCIIIYCVTEVCIHCSQLALEGDIMCAQCPAWTMAFGGEGGVVHCDVCALIV